jgi:hypothetical protein
MPIDNEPRTRDEANQLRQGQGGYARRVLDDEQLGVYRYAEEDGMEDRDDLVGYSDRCSDDPREGGDDSRRRGEVVKVDVRNLEQGRDRIGLWSRFSAGPHKQYTPCPRAEDAP